MRRMYSKKELENIVNVTKKDIASLVDKDGHNRFIEGAGTPSEITGLTSTYCKWSLSGTHLMLVFCATLAEGASLNNSGLVEFTLPAWIKNKINPVWSVYIEAKSIKVYASDWSTQEMGIVLEKTSNGIKVTQTGGEFVLTKERNFRIVFDLMIDNA